MPKLRNMIYNYFDQELSLDDVLHDDQNVVLGASIHAQALRQYEKDKNQKLKADRYILMDVTPHSIILDTHDKKNEPKLLFNRNTAWPPANNTITLKATHEN